jgi:hypothetical protein
MFYFLFSVASWSSKLFYSLDCKIFTLGLSGLTYKTEDVIPRFSVCREDRNRSSFRKVLLLYSVVTGMLRRCAKPTKLAGLAATVQYHRQNQLESFRPIQNQ